MQGKLQFVSGPHILPVASASSIQYYKGLTYVIGDDSPFMLVVGDDAFSKFRKVQLINNNGNRIPKPDKPDFEASVIIEGAAPRMLIIGSASTPVREKMLLLQMDDLSRREEISSKVFVDRIRQMGISEVNIEAAGNITGAGKIILSSRGNTSNPVNKIVITDKDFYKKQGEAELRVVEIVLPETGAYAGVSDFCYWPKEDMLFFTATTEDTTNAYDDGVIGDSYLGWIENISTKLSGDIFMPNAFYNLCELDKSFKGQKIEGVCIRQFSPALSLLLAADSDKEESSGLWEVEVTEI